MKSARALFFFLLISISLHPHPPNRPESSSLFWGIVAPLTGVVVGLIVLRMRKKWKAKKAQQVPPATSVVASQPPCARCATLEVRVRELTSQLDETTPSQEAGDCESCVSLQNQVLFLNQRYQSQIEALTTSLKRQTQWRERDEKIHQSQVNELRQALASLRARRSQPISPAGVHYSGQSDHE